MSDSIRMSDPNYVHQNIYDTVPSVCSEGTFKKHLENVTISHLMVLNDDDLTGELAGDLKYVLDWSTEIYFGLVKKKYS